MPDPKPSIHLYNTLTRTVEDFTPLSKDGTVSVYCCGPTPYNHAHIGNLRTYLTEDTIIKIFRLAGYDVRTVMNITDIDDKTIRDSQKSGLSLYDFTEKYTQIFLEDIAKLGITPADTIARISTVIPEMVTIINDLLAKGIAYLADDGSIYYRVEKFPTYGELAHLDRSGMRTSVRINNDEYSKDEACDFALWKAYDPEKDGENFWEEKFFIDGEKRTIKGRPGWHIECSACNLRYHGEQIDIHMGGVDNIFPHHQNEIAQTEAYTGKPFSRYWIHGGHLLVDNKKMAKSANNFYTLADVLAWTPDVPEGVVCRALRLMNLQTRYRENFNFTFERLRAAVTSIEYFDNALRVLGAIFEKPAPLEPSDKIIVKFLKEHESDFMTSLCDDFNTPEAVACIFKVISYLNTEMNVQMAHPTSFSMEVQACMKSLLESTNSVLGILDISLLSERERIPRNIFEYMIERTAAKQSRDFARSDAIRAQVESEGYRIIDLPDGTSRAERM